MERVFFEISQLMFVPICTRMMMETGLVSFVDTILRDGSI